MLNETDYANMTGPQLYKHCGSDARRWAEAFCQIAKPRIDVDTMQSWFSNAMMAMYDANRRIDEKPS